MNDLETRLQDSRVKPRRALRADFTNQTIAALGERASKPKYRPKWKEFIPVKLFSKPAFVATAFVATLAIGGSAYAAVGGISGIKALFGGETSLPGGDRIVKVETRDCPHVNAFNIADKSRADNDSYYYRIKASSKLTNDQVVHIVQGYCEADSEGVANSPLAAEAEQLPQNTGKLIGGYADTVITKLSNNSITITYDMPYGVPGHADQTVLHHTVQTYALDPGTMVIYNGTKQTLTDLQVGDHVSISYRTTSDEPTKTTGPDKIDTSKATVAVVTKLSKHMQEYFEYGKYNHTDFDQVVPCKSDPSGYCSASEYLNQKKST